MCGSKPMPPLRLFQVWVLLTRPPSVAESAPSSQHPVLPTRCRLHTKGLCHPGKSISARKSRHCRQKRTPWVLACFWQMQQRLPAGNLQTGLKSWHTRQYRTLRSWMSCAEIFVCLVFHGVAEHVGPGAELGPCMVEEHIHQSRQSSDIYVSCGNHDVWASEFAWCRSTPKRGFRPPSAKRQARIFISFSFF